MSLTLWICNTHNQTSIMVLYTHIYIFIVASRLPYQIIINAFCKKKSFATVFTILCLMVAWTHTLCVYLFILPHILLYIYTSGVIQRATVFRQWFHTKCSRLMFFFKYETRSGVAIRGSLEERSGNICLFLYVCWSCWVVIKHLKLAIQNMLEVNSDHLLKIEYAFRFRLIFINVSSFKNKTKNMFYF